MALAIADVRYLWSEVDRLKTQVNELQAADRLAQEQAQRMKEYVSTFVTHAQLDAALCTRISQSMVTSQVDKLRMELLVALEKKADVDAVTSMSSKKLDISVFESSTWDLKKFRNALEQQLHDLFASFAHQIESQVASKLSIDDFNHIFNPDANGQKAAIENAATRLSRMNDQIEALKDFVAADKQRQHQMADMNVSLLDLTRKQNASRNAIAQLTNALGTTQLQVTALETKANALSDRQNDTDRRVNQVNDDLMKQNNHCSMQIQAIHNEMETLARQNQLAMQEMESVRQFTQDGILKPLETKMNQLSQSLHSTIDQLQVQQRCIQLNTNQQLHHVNEKLATIHQQTENLETKVQKLDLALGKLQVEFTHVKGPLVTVATNLREENVAILEEIQRSQQESRGIMLDYCQLLERDDHQPLPKRPSSSLPSRPSTSSGAIIRSVASASFSRKTKHQQALKTVTTRPHTSSARTPRTLVHQSTTKPMTAPPTARQASNRPSSSLATASGENALFNFITPDSEWTTVVDALSDQV